MTAPTRRTSLPEHAAAIELVGRPGCGKTAVAARLAEQVPVVVVDPLVEVTGRGLVGRLGLTLRAPLAALLLLVLVMARRGAGWHDLAKVYGLQKRYLATRSLARGEHTGLVDEGIVHGCFVAGWGTTETGISRSALAVLVRGLARRGVAWVWLRADPAMSEERLRSRVPPSRFAGLGPSLDEGYGRHMEHVAAVAPAAVVTVDADDAEQLLHAWFASR